MKIFVTVGTHSQQFDRLLKAMDGLKAGKLAGDEIFAQSGNCEYKPENFKSGNFISDREYTKWMEGADIIISHAGAGSIINALRNGKALIIVPRLEKFGEHVNDHQRELAEAMERGGFAIAVENEDLLGEAVKRARDFRPKESKSKAQTVGLIKEFLGNI